jgi:aminobenzoyl-glutamate utilization protein B
MTETSLAIEVDRACSDVIRNSTIEQRLMANLLHLGPPPFDEADRRFADELSATMTEADIQECIDAFRGPGTARGLDQSILPLADEPGTLTGSCDVGDVSQLVPASQYLGACYSVGTNFHTWQLVTQGKTAAAHKGMLHAAKALAATAVDFFRNPELIEQARTELRTRTGGRAYVCPIPEDVVPPPVRHQAKAS